MSFLVIPTSSNEKVSLFTGYLKSIAAAVKILEIICLLIAFALVSKYDEQVLIKTYQMKYHLAITCIGWIFCTLLLVLYLMNIVSIMGNKTKATFIILTIFYIGIGVLILISSSVVLDEYKSLTESSITISIFGRNIVTLFCDDPNIDCNLYVASGAIGIIAVLMLFFDALLHIFTYTTFTSPSSGSNVENTKPSKATTVV